MLPSGCSRPAAESLNIHGAFLEVLGDLGFAATIVAAVVGIATGFDQADSVASLLIAC